MNYEHFLKSEFLPLLDQITPERPTQWGKMSPQNIVEHIGLSLMISNGSAPQQASAEPERMAYRKSKFMAEYVPMPKGVRVPFAPEDAPPHHYPSMDAAKDKVRREWQKFYDYYAQHPDAAEMHPMFGPLNFAEWTEIHARHFRHHLEQLGFEFA